MDSTHHKDVLQKNHVLLVDELNPDLFLHMLEPCLGKTCVDSIRDQPTQKDKTRKLLWLLGTVPKEKYNYHCKVIAGLYPSVFKVLKGREAEKEELDFFLQTYTSELRRSVLAAGNVPDNEIDQPIDLDTQYVGPVLQDESDGQAALGDNVLPAVHLKNLENQGKVGLEMNKILPIPSRGTSTILKGRAGVGKSTLTQYLIRQWAKGQWETSKTCAFLLNLRTLVHVKEKVTFTELLSMHAEYTTDTPDQKQLSFEWLKNNAHNVMFFTDGIDELPDIGPLLKRTPKLSLTGDQEATPLHWCINLMQKNILQDCTQILISRPFDDLKKIPHDRVVDVLGLTKEKIAELIEKNVKLSRRNVVNETLLGNPVLLSVCSITFYCAALCRVLEVNSDIKGISLNTYTRITAFLIMGLAARKASEEATCFFMSDSLQKCLPYLAALAHRGLMQFQKGLTKLVFSGEDLRATGISQEGLREAKQSGLLMYSKCKDPENPHLQKLQAQFIHLSVQELLAAAKMVVPGVDWGEQEIASGCLNMKDVFAFGLVFDKESQDVNDLRQAVSQRVNTCLETEMDSKMLKIFRKLCDIADCTQYTFLQALLIAHESQRKDLAAELAEKLITNDVLTVDISQMTAIDIMALCFVINEARFKKLDLRLTYRDAASAMEMQNLIISHTTNKHVEINLIKITIERLRIICDGGRSPKGQSHTQAVKTLSRNDGIGYQSDAIMNVHFAGIMMKTDISQVDLSRVKQGTTEHSGTLNFSNIAQLYNIINLSRGLKYFQLNNVIITDGDMKTLSTVLSRKTSLEHLSLSNCGPMTDEGLGYLCEAIKAQHSLTHLSLRKLVIPLEAAKEDFLITDKGMKYLADAVTYAPSLTHLHLEGASFSDVGMGYLSAAFVSSQTKKSLKLVDVELGNQGLRHLSDTLKLSSGLKHLTIISRDITLQGISHLSDGIRLSTNLDSIVLQCIINDTPRVNALEQLNDAIRSTKHLVPLKLDFILLNEEALWIDVHIIRAGHYP